MISERMLPIMLGLLALSLLVVAFANVMRLIDPPTYLVTVECPAGYPWYNTETGLCYSEPAR